MLKLCDGKYKFYVGEPGVLICDRYDKPWRDFTGDKAVQALYDYAQELRSALEGIAKSYPKTDEGDTLASMAREALK